MADLKHPTSITPGYDFHEMVDLMPQMIWVSRADGYHDYYNQRWYEFTGVAKGTTDGTDKSWNGVFHPDDAERARPQWLASQQSGQPYEIEYRLRRADGMYRWVLSRATPVRDAQGNILRWYGTCTDIQDLVDAREKAQAANVAKSEFLANMSHEIRTPMNAIIGLGNILMKVTKDEQQRKYLGTQQVAAESLLALINDMLDIAKIEDDSFRIEQQTFSLKTLMQRVISMMAVKANEKKLALSVNYENIASDIYLGDAVRIQQVMVNLINNAIKFTALGGVSVTIRDAGADEQQRHQLTFDVTDTGIGIAEDKLSLIFEKFTQSDSSITREYGGTGLGLTISKALVERMGGAITVASTPGAGSTFTVTLPLTTGSQLPIINDEPSIGIPMDVSGKKVLLVEDYEANILVATTLLEDFGCTYDVASNGRDAVAKVKESRYDVILMDVQMHGMDGYEATRQIRQWEEEQKQPPHRIIAMTAHALFGDKEHCISAGMDDYLSKPFNPDELHKKILNVADAA